MHLSKTALKRYSPMLMPYFQESEIKEFLSRLVRIFSRHDRIIWALRSYKVKSLVNKKAGGDSLSRHENRFLKNHSSWIGNPLNDLDLAMYGHYLTQPIASIQAITFVNQSAEEINALLKQAEDAYLSNIKDQHRDLAPQGTSICKVTDNLEWFDLEKSKSYELGRSMRDCGNSNAQYSDTIYSLSEKIVSEDGTVKWRPQVTFIYNKHDKSLGERKGRFNQKPDKQWHEAIVKLLSERLEIQSLNQSTQYYEKENDFTFSDLDSSLYTKLSYARPDLTQLKADATKDDYDMAIEAWAKHSERTDLSGITTAIVNTYSKKRISISSQPHRTELAFAFSLDANLLSGKNITMPEKAEAMAVTFISAFLALPLAEACDGFVEVYNKAEKQGGADNALFYLNKYYPERVAEACETLFNVAA